MEEREAIERLRFTDKSGKKFEVVDGGALVSVAPDDVVEGTIATRWSSWLRGEVEGNHHCTSGGDKECAREEKAIRGPWRFDFGVTGSREPVTLSRPQGAGPGAEMRLMRKEARCTER